MSDKADVGPRFIITLVHGTFARNAAWTRPASYLCRSLRDQIACPDLLITPFRWSGWNSPWSRKRAARTLRAELARQVASYPEARHYVIGHSHGGALALQAVYDENALPLQVAGIATMATPFIHTRKRGIAPFNYSEMLTWLCFLPLAGAGVWGLLRMWAAYVWGIHDGPVVNTATLGCLIAVAYGALVIARALSRALLRLAEDTSVSLQCSLPEGSNLLIIRTSGDEASAVLAFSQLLSWLVSRIWLLVGILLRPLFSLLRVLERFSQFVPAVLIVLCFASLFVLMMVVVFASALVGIGRYESLFDLHLFVEALEGLLFPFRVPADERVIGEMALSALMGVIVLIGGTFALLACFVLPALILLSIVLLPFGPESALSALLVEVSVESVPPGRWCIYQFTSAEGTRGGPLALAHSAAYEDERVLSLLASWIVR